MSDLKKTLKKYLKNGDSVLELGCGNGDLINSIARDYELKKIVASDFFNKPKNLDEGIFYIEQNLEKFDLQEKFNIIIMHHVLEHVKNPIGLLENLKNNLHENGKIIIVVPNRYGYRNEAKVYLPEHGKHYFLWDMEAMDYTLQRLGFACRFHDLYVRTNNYFVKLFCMIFRIQSSDLVCVAMKEKM